jgi:hypothetical protein
MSFLYTDSGAAVKILASVRAMHLVTVATESKGYFPVLKQSVERFDAKLEVLGWGKRWRGFVWRLMLLREFLEGLDDEDIICFLDAYDVVLLRDPAELEAAFRSLSAATGCNIVFGCDKPKPLALKAAARYMFGQCQGKSVNAGSYVGYVWAVKDMLDSILAKTQDPKDDDQVQVVRFCKESPDKIHVDCDNILFLTFVNTLRPFEEGSNIKIAGDGTLLHNGIRPFVAHGAGQTCMSDLIIKLGYDLPDIERLAVRKYHLNATVKKAFEYSKFFTNLFLLALVIAASVWLWNNRAK